MIVFIVLKEVSKPSLQERKEKKDERRGVDEKKRRREGGREGGRKGGREQYEGSGGRERRWRMEKGDRGPTGKDITCANLYYKDVVMRVI